jgi:hypothetical protein
MFDQRQNIGHGQVLMLTGVLPEVCAGQFEQGRSGSKPVLLQMNERACQLDQPFVKSAVGPVPVFEPKLFQNIVRLVILALIKTIKITLVIGIQPGSGLLLDHARDSFTLVAHRPIIAASRWNPIPFAEGRD